MIWIKGKIYHPDPYELEVQLEEAVQEVRDDLFGPTRCYLETKRLIGEQGKTRNVPDAYLIDLSSPKSPKLFVVENDLEIHGLRHIAVQILQFSISFESSPHRVKGILREALQADPEAMQKCVAYTHRSGMDNIDILLEEMIYRKNAFAALLIIDSLQDEMKTALTSRFEFPVETVVLERFRSADGDVAHMFEPFLDDVPVTPIDRPFSENRDELSSDEVDTVVVPARIEGFEETFLGEHRWYAIRIHDSMIPKIKHIAGYQTAPVSAITHIADIDRIEPHQDTGKYCLWFSGPAEKIGPIPLGDAGRGKAPQAPRYTTRERVMAASSVEEVFS